MKKKLIRILKTAGPLILGLLLIWYSFSSATAAERQMLWEHITLADPTWIIISLVCGVLSHLSRAYRWKYLLEPMGYRPRLANSFMAVMGGYLANYGVPRSGEVLRGATISTYEDIPFDKAIGTIVSERIADLVMLILILGFGMVIQTEDLLAYLSQDSLNPIIGILAVLLVILLGVLGLIIVKRSEFSLAVKIRRFARGLLEGMRSILKMEKKGLFVFHTVFIWVMYMMMFYVVKFTIPETADLSLAGIMAAFIVGSVAISTTNGGIGVYPLAMGAILLLFDVSKQAGEAFGWIVWGSQTLMVIVLGGLSLLLLPVFNRRK